MKKLDQSQRFLFENHPIRGQYVSLDETWQTIAKQAGLAGKGLSLLGEALAAVVLLVDTLKIKGSVTLQIRGKGPLGLLVVEANSEHKVRGIARQEGEIEKEMSIQEVFGSDCLVITIKTEGAEPYQGIVPLQGVNLAAALEYYFDTSEQLSTRFWLACDEHNVSGMLIQKLPGKSKDEDAWDRTVQLAATVTAAELQQLPIDTLLHRLYHQETVRLFDSSAIDFSCSCSRERTSNMLFSLGKAEVKDIIEQEGEVAVTCEFCNECYCFDLIDIEQLFLEGEPVLPSTTTH
jgi:molecular chaperone Hsp33